MKQDCAKCGSDMLWKNLEKPVCPKCDAPNIDVTVVCEKTSKTKSLRQAVRRLVRAEVEASWLGSKTPGEKAEIEAELQRAKNALTSILERIVK